MALVGSLNNETVAKYNGTVIKQNDTSMLLINYGLEGTAYGLSVVVMFDSYNYFSSSVTFFQIPEGLRGLAQRVCSVDDRLHPTGIDKLRDSFPEEV